MEVSFCSAICSVLSNNLHNLPHQNFYHCQDPTSSMFIAATRADVRKLPEVHATR